MQKMADLSMGRKIRERRAKSGLNQTELADKVGVGVYQTTVSQWELGKQKPDPAQLERLG
jgi:transcriptional regulator with XRE-family HTH domain